MIIDFHTHAYPDALAARAVSQLSGFYQLEFEQTGTVDDLLQSLQSAGCECGVMLPTAVSPRNVTSINSWALTVMRELPMIKSFAALHPLMDGLADEAARVIAEGFHGVKLHPDFQQFNADSPEAFALYEQIEGKLPLMIHAGDLRHDYSAPRRIARVLDNFPRLTVIAAHLGGCFNYGEMTEALLGRDLYLDTSSALWILDSEQSRYIISRHDSDKLLFGSDYPLHTTSYEYSLLQRLRLPDALMEKITLTNARRLLADVRTC